ncbi:MAG: hypothetical protein MR684_02010, partial [Clostridium sp.]|nr:hypothetical protein [Clostridium sp.]
TKQNYTDRDPQSRSGSIFFALLRKSPHLPLTALLKGNVSPMLDASTKHLAVQAKYNLQTERKKNIMKMNYYAR